MAFVIVALDGPTGVGKSTLARQLAERNQLLYVNTGSMFRCLAWKWNHLNKPEKEEALHISPKCPLLLVKCTTFFVLHRNQLRQLLAL